MTERKPFEERDHAPLRGVKLKNNENSTKSAAVVEARRKEKLEEQADQLTSTIQDNNKQALELAQKFIKVCRDRSIPANQGVLSKQYERDLKNELLNFAIASNNDVTQNYDGMGSIAVLAIVLKVLLEQRDRINELEYKIVQLGKNKSSSDA